MNKSAYAKLRGVSRQTVYDWIAKGEVVVTDGKIDTDATEHRQQAAHKPEATTNRTLEMTWAKFWRAIKSNDGKFPIPTTDDEIRQWVTNAVDEMHWEVEFLDEGGICLDDGDGVHYFVQYDFLQNACLAISLLRAEICCTACEFPDEKDYWSTEGIKALSLRR
ncbi:hypothetical protein ACLMPP_19005 [Yersinia enterocolitica]|uniref:hypothetical protein n=1 Tax=Yersinia enterocolitica TaxID=630 RepID=UPI00398D161F